MVCSKIFLLLLSDYLGIYHMPYFERKDSVSTMSLKSNLDCYCDYSAGKNRDEWQVTCSLFYEANSWLRLGENTLMRPTL